MKHRASLFLIVIGIVCLLLFRRLKGIKEGFIVCSPGQYIWSTVCVDCLSGEYCPAGTTKTSRKFCTLGYYCPTPATQLPCSATGSYCSTGSTTQKQCNPDYYCPTNSTIIQCPAGKTSPAGSTNVSQCVCAPGTYGPSCTPCPTGSFCTNGVINSCTAGTYQPNTGQTSCLTCPTGSSCAADGAQASTPGLTSFTCAAGYQVSGTSCAVCPSGQTSTAGGTCSICPAGTACINGVKTPCVAGSTFSGIGASNCTACPPGSVCSVTGFTCGAGYQALNSTCSPCTAGQTSIAAGPCSNCPANTYNGISGQPSCSNCSVGSYSSAGASSCTTCPPNTLSCTSATSLVCKPGYSNAGTACINCPTGYACSGTSNTQCTAGTYSAGMQATCSNCSIGQYSAAGAASCATCTANSVSCTTATSFTCTSNYYSNANVCSQCPPNSTCAPGGSSAGLTGVTTLTCSPGFSNGGNSNCVRIKYGSVMPYYTKGSIDEMNNNMPTTNRIGCDSDINNNSCQYTWYTGPGTSNIGPSSANPCPSRNSWYDFDRKTCIDGLGNPILTKNVCPSNSVYSLRDNICVPVRKAFANQPPNTVGLPSLSSPGDFGDCKSVDLGDCTPYFFNSNTNTTTQTNPCGPGSIYSFPAKGCITTSSPSAPSAPSATRALSPPSAPSATSATNDSNACCGIPASNLASNAACSKYVSMTTSNIKNNSLCSGSPPNICCGSSMANIAKCVSGGYWKKSSNLDYNTSYKTLCGIAGFQDYTNNFDTMAAVV